MKEANYPAERDLALADFLGSSFDNWDLILAALFLWITLFLAARSASEIADAIFAAVLVFLATLMAASNFETISLLTDSFFLLPRSARFAVFVTGIIFRL